MTNTQVRCPGCYLNNLSGPPKSYIIGWMDFRFFYSPSVFNSLINEVSLSRHFGTGLLLIHKAKQTRNMIGILMLTWFARNSQESDARWAIILALFVYDAIGFVVTLLAIISGALNPLAWLGDAIC